MSESDRVIDRFMVVVIILFIIVAVTSIIIFALMCVYPHIIFEFNNKTSNS